MRGELETEQNCNILTPTPMAITAFPSCSPRLLNREPGGPASLGHDPHSSIFSLTPTAQSGVLRAPSSRCWFSLQHLIPNWLELPVHRVILLFYAHSIQPVDSQGYPLDTFDWMHLLFTQVHFLFWQLGRGQYATQELHSFRNFARVTRASTIKQGQVGLKSWISRSFFKPLN